MNELLKTCTVLVLVSSTAACTAGSGLFSAFESDSSPPQDAAQNGFGSAALDDYLRLMEDLLEGDAVIQAETFQRVSSDALAEPNTSNQLRLAIALATPGHAGSNAEHAQREFRELLAGSELLLPEERILAAMLLAQIEQRLLLDLEAEQTQAASIAAMTQRTGALEQRVESLQDENQSLRGQLEEAQNIIDEISNIEQSIRERESAD